MTNNGIVMSDVEVETMLKEWYKTNLNRGQFVRACLVTYGCKGMIDLFSFINDYRYINSQRISLMCCEYIKSSKFKLLVNQDIESRKVFFEIINKYKE